MSKYIINNCPIFGTDYYCGEGFDRCSTCTDCVMKCIKSKLDYLKYYINNDNSANLSKMNEIIDGTLQLLDIQEVE